MNGPLRCSSLLAQVLALSLRAQCGVADTRTTDTSRFRLHTLRFVSYKQSQSSIHLVLRDNSSDCALIDRRSRIHVVRSQYTGHTRTYGATVICRSVCIPFVIVVVRSFALMMMMIYTRVFLATAEQRENHRKVATADSGRNSHCLERSSIGKFRFLVVIPDWVSGLQPER